MGKPKIRFKGYTDDWEQRKLGDILERRIEQRQQSEEYPRLAFASGQGVIPLSERKTNNREQLTKDEFTKKYLVTELDDIVYNPANVKYGAIDRNKCGRGLISPIYVTFTTSEIPGFIERIVTSYDFQQRALRFEEGTVTKRQSVNPEDLVTLDVLLPHQREEQKKVGAYFDKLDHLITLHQRKCEETKKLKKYMLQKMFPQDGQVVPEIRFKGFTDAWEQRKLGDVIEKLTGGASITPDDYVDAGYRTIPKGAVNSSGVADMSGCKNVSEYFFKKNISSKTSSGELVTSLRDLVPTAPNMGRIVRICGETEDFLMPQGVYSIIVKEKISEDFLITYSNSPEYRKIIMAEKNGSTQVHMRNGEFLNIDIPLPSYEEQKKVGDYFRSLDHLITLHQNKCNELQNMKKFMLKNMFV